MQCDRKSSFAGLAAFAIVMVGASGAVAQSIQTYRCADGTRFILGTYPEDSRAFLQIDGGEVTLARRLWATGSRYSARGVTLNIAKSGVATIRHLKRPSTSCEVVSSVFERQGSRLV